MDDEKDNSIIIDLEGKLTSVTSNTLGPGVHFAEFEVRPKNSNDPLRYSVYRVPFSEEDYLNYLNLNKQMKECVDGKKYIGANFSIKLKLKEE